jgi:hypothetical protein
MPVSRALSTYSSGSVARESSLQVQFIELPHRGTLQFQSPFAGTALFLSIKEPVFNNKFSLPKLNRKETLNKKINYTCCRVKESL